MLIIILSPKRSDLAPLNEHRVLPLTVVNTQQRNSGTVQSPGGATFVIYLVYPLDGDTDSYKLVCGSHT